MDILNVKEEEYWKTIQGVSLLPSITENRPVSEYALIEYNKSVQQFFLTWRKYPDFDIRHFNYRIKALRSLKYKYIWYSNGVDELYDLENDPGEKHNIASEHPEIVKKMRDEIERILLSIEIVDYGDIPALPKRITRFGEVAKQMKQIHDRLRA